MDRIDAATRDCFPPDRFLGGARLHAPTTGKRVMATGGRRAVFDGPFLESKEVIGGIFFMRMSNVDEAVRWASNLSEFLHQRQPSLIDHHGKGKARSVMVWRVPVQGRMMICPGSAVSSFLTIPSANWEMLKRSDAMPNVSWPMLRASPMAKS